GCAALHEFFERSPVPPRCPSMPQAASHNPSAPPDVTCPSSLKSAWSSRIEHAAGWVALLAAAAATLVGAGQANAGTFAVTSLADSGPGSLRQAILDANASPGADVIQFNIPSS